MTAKRSTQAGYDGRVRWCWPMFLLAACAGQAAAPPIAPPSAAPVVEPELVATPPATKVGPRPTIAAGERCPALGPWERPAAPCIAELDKPEEPWRARIEVPRIRFEVAKSKLNDASVEVVDGVAALLMAHPEFELLEIHAHTDSKASDHY